jgi:copper homeostasis protein (lipoprotein)
MNPRSRIIPQCRLVTVIVLIILYSTGCRNQEGNEELLKRTGDSYIDTMIGRIENNSFNTVFVYEGMLPCADCSGIDTRLIFIHDELIYILTEKYMGIMDGDDHTYSSYGPYNVMRGFGENPDAVVFVLNPESPEVSRHYLSDDPMAIRMLDRDMRPFETSLNYTLDLIYISAPEE